jgi:hypothetical protein
MINPHDDCFRNFITRVKDTEKAARQYGNRSPKVCITLSEATQQKMLNMFRSLPIIEYECTFQGIHAHKVVFMILNFDEVELV